LYNFQQRDKYSPCAEVKNASTYPIYIFTAWCLRTGLTQSLLLLTNTIHMGFEHTPF